METKRALSVLIGIVFMVQQTGWAIPADGLVIAPGKEVPAFFQIEIPEELASIEEIYQAPLKAEPHLILYIQNAHGSYEAQIKIKKLLEYLNRKYGFKLIFVEGAVEKLNAEYLKLFPDPEVNAQLADYLTKQGELTGAEFYLMQGPGDVEAVGIEETSLYRSNYEAFKNVHRARADGDAFLDGIDRRLQTLASRIFTADARRLLSEWRKFESGRRDFLPYVRQLAVESKKVLGVDLESLFSQVEWPQLTRLLVLQTMEKDLNRLAAEKERTALIGFLESQNVSAGLIAELRDLGEKRISVSRLDGGSRKSEDSPRNLLERLLEEAAPKGFRFHDYPAFSLYAGYLILQSELESRKLFGEIEILFKKILDELAGTEMEKNLLELFRDEELLKKLFHLELTRAEWGRVYYRREWIEPKAMSRRIAAVRNDMENSARFRADKKISTLSTPGEDDKMPEDKTSLLEGVFGNAFRFYDFARQRESVFREKIRSEMGLRKANKAILITGGFHSEGVMDLLREDEINYGILMPKLTQAVDHVNYVTTMMEDRQTLFDIANLEMPVRSQARKTLGQMGPSADHELRVILNAALPILAKIGADRLGDFLKFLSDSPWGKDRGVRIVAAQTADEPYGYDLILGDARYRLKFELRKEGAYSLKKISGPDTPSAFHAVDMTPPDFDAMQAPGTVSEPDAVVSDAGRAEVSQLNGEYARVLLGRDLHAKIVRDDAISKTLDTPAVLTMLSGGIAEGGADNLRILKEVARAVSPKVEGYDGVREELGAILPVFKHPDMPGVCGIMIPPQMNLTQAKAFVESLAGILVLQRYQAIRIFARSSENLSDQDIRELELIVEQSEKLRDDLGEVIGKRIGLNYLNLKDGTDFSVYRERIAKGLNQSASIIHRKIKGQASLWSIQQHAVFVTAHGQIEIMPVSMENRIEGIPDGRYDMNALGATIGVNLSEKGSWAELDQDSQRALERHEQYLIMMQSQLEAMGAAQVAGLLKKAFEIASKVAAAA
jgi:hypothetical protein